MSLHAMPGTMPFIQTAQGNGAPLVAQPPPGGAMDQGAVVVVDGTPVRVVILALAAAAGLTALKWAGFRYNVSVSS